MNVNHEQIGKKKYFYEEFYDQDIINEEKKLKASIPHRDKICKIFPKEYIRKNGSNYAIKILIKDVLYVFLDEVLKDIIHKGSVFRFSKGKKSHIELKVIVNKSNDIKNIVEYDSKHYRIGTSIKNPKHKNQFFYNLDFDSAKYTNIFLNEIKRRFSYDRV